MVRPPTTDNLVAAAVQAAPVFLDRDATVDKATGLIAQAAAQGASLIAFPETFVPTQPGGNSRIVGSDGDLLAGPLVDRESSGPCPVSDRAAAAPGRRH